MDKTDEMHAPGNYALQKRGNVSEYTMVEEDDRDRVNLAKVGKKQVLKRRFGLMSMTGFSCGLMCTWEAMLVVFLLGFQNGGPSGLVYGFILTWIGTLSVCITLGELSSMVPTAGGQYHWVSILAPASSKKFLSYIVGWLTVTGWIAGLTATAFFVSTLIQALVVQNEPNYQPAGWQGTLLFWAVLLLCVAINTVLSSVLPFIEILILILHLLGFIAILIPLVYLAPQRNSASSVFKTFLNEGGWSTQALSFFIGLNGNAVAFVGTDGAVHMSEEVKNASTNVARSMVFSVVINGVLAFAMLLAILFCGGDIGTEAAESASLYPFISIFAQTVGSNLGGTIMTAIIVVLQFCSAVGGLAAASRMTWSFARDQGLPGSQLLSRINARTTIPLVAITVVTILAALLGLINIGSSTALNDVISLVLEGFYTSYFVACSLLLYRRVRGDIGDHADGHFGGPAGLKPYTWGPWRVPGAIGILNNACACVYLIVLSFFSFWPTVLPVTPANMNYSSLVTGTVVICSVTYYVTWARKIYRGPIVEVEVHNSQ